jgi:hypothetical protein
MLAAAYDLLVPLRRPLSEREREVLDHLLSTDFPGVEALRMQADHVLVEIESDVDPTVNLVVTGADVPFAEVVDRTPVEAWSTRDWNSDDFVQVILFVDDGRLSSLELNWYENIPEEFPAPSELRAPRPYSGDYVGET